MNAVTTFNSRLPMPQGLEGMDARTWRVLCETTFPNAQSPEAIVMALDYCKARGLDVFKRPVHIVPMWNSRLGKNVETVWPGINEIQVTAARTRQWAGMDEPQWGPEKSRTFAGRRKTNAGWEPIKADVTFPEWCAVTVYRLINGHRCPFTEPVFWLEAYSRSGGAHSELPTDMWIKRPRGQLHKVAKAASLRAAFPEEGELTAEEMEGKEIETGGVVIEHEPRRPPIAPSVLQEPQEVPPHDPETGEIVDDGLDIPASLVRREKPGVIQVPKVDGTSNYIEFGKRYIAAVKGCKTLDEANDWFESNQATHDAMKQDAPKVYERMTTAVNKIRAELAKPSDLVGDGEILLAG